MDPYGSGSDNEEEIDSLMLQAYTNSLPNVAQESNGKNHGKDSGLSSSVLKGLDDDCIESDNERRDNDWYVPAVAPTSVMINTTNEITEDDQPKSAKYKRRRYYDEEDLSLICYNCGQAGHASFECVEEKKETKCRECGEMGHMKFKCPNRLCYNCLKRGHTSRDCKKTRTKICFRCNGEGHSANQCRANLEYAPERRTPVLYTVGRGTGKYFCFNCGLEGHTAKECSEPTMNEIHRYSYSHRGNEGGGGGGYYTPPRKRRR